MEFFYLYNPLFDVKVLVFAELFFIVNGTLKR